MRKFVCVWFTAAYKNEIAVHDASFFTTDNGYSLDDINTIINMREGNSYPVADGHSVMRVPGDFAPAYPVDEDLLDAHFRIVEYITVCEEEDRGSMVHIARKRGGQGEVNELARDLSVKFQAIHKDTEWGVELDFEDTMQDFLSDEEAAYEIHEQVLPYKSEVN